MDYKTGLLLITFFVGSFALPAVDTDLFLYPDGVAPRIIGGREAAQGSHPHMVALSRGGSVRAFFCGGSLISRRSVLTAAHCISDASGRPINLSNVRATVGTNRWNSGGSHHQISRGVRHPNYHHQNIKNDIAVLTTSSNVALNNQVRVVRLNFGNIGGGVRSLVAGWGRTRVGGQSSAVLMELEVNSLQGRQCEDDVRRFARQNNIRAPPVDSRVELCTFRATGRGTCQGDSGSALRRVDNGQQIGVVSWGFPCAIGAPDMYVRVSAFRSFIESNMSN